MKRISAGFAAFAFAAPGALAQSDIRPGQWEISVEFSVPSDPAFTLAPITRSQCFAAGDAQDPGRMLTQVSVPGATGCTFSGKSESPGHLDFSVKCEGTLGISGRGSVNFTPTTMQGTLDLDFNAGDPKSAKRTGSVSKVSARRTGDC
jgi:hypothetical protein